MKSIRERLIKRDGFGFTDRGLGVAVTLCILTVYSILQITSTTESIIFCLSLVCYIWLLSYEEGYENGRKTATEDIKIIKG